MGFFQKLCGHWFKKISQARFPPHHYLLALLNCVWPSRTANHYCTRGYEDHGITSNLRGSWLPAVLVCFTSTVPPPASTIKVHILRGSNMMNGLYTENAQINSENARNDSVCTPPSHARLTRGTSSPSFSKKVLFYEQDEERV